MTNEKKDSILESKSGSKWHEDNRKVASVLLIAYFIYMIWGYLFFSLAVLPLAYLVKKGSRAAIIISGLYFGFMTIVFIANYIENNRDAAGIFASSLNPVYIYLIAFVALCRFLYLAFKEKK